MNDDLTHTVTVSIEGNYPHGQKQHAQVIVAGDGDLEHVLDAFRTALVAAGFSCETAARLTIGDEP